MTGDEAPAPAGIRRNAGLAFGAQLTAGVFTAVLTLYLVRELGPAAFGTFSIALSIGALVMLPADVGLSQSAARFLAESRGNKIAMVRVLGTALRMKLVAAALVGALLFALAGPIASAYDIPSLLWPLRAMAVAVVAQSILGLFRSSFAAVGRMGADWTMIAGESAVETAASIALVALGAGAAGAAWGRAIGYGVGVAVGLALAVRLLGLGVLRPPRADRAFVRRLVGYGFALLIIDGVYSVFAQIDVLLVGAILGAGAAGVFAAPLRIVAVLLYPALALTAAVAPRMVRSGDGPPAVAPLEHGLSLLLLVHLMAIAAVLAWAEPLVKLILGPGYGEAADVLRALTPFILLAGPARLLTASVNYLGEARRRIAVVLAALALNIVLDLLLIPRIGVVGAAVGNDVAFALYAFGHLHICRRLTDLSLVPVVKSLGRGLIAAAAMSAVLLAIGHGDVATAWIVVGLPVGTATFLACLVALREPLLAELWQSAPGWARRRLPLRARR
ncbi:MAG: polysaccharide biosynthesis protein [Solirubrobacterales bacterium]|nr:polysaccharide biosynthesis protein [Solirubrobacterales bacterium]